MIVTYSFYLVYTYVAASPNGDLLQIEEPRRVIEVKLEGGNLRSWFYASGEA